MKNLDKHYFITGDDSIKLFIDNRCFIGEAGFEELLVYRSTYLKRTNLTFHILDGFENPRYFCGIHKTQDDKLMEIIRAYDTLLDNQIIDNRLKINEVDG